MPNQNATSWTRNCPDLLFSRDWILWSSEQEAGTLSLSHQVLRNSTKQSVTNLIHPTFWSWPRLYNYTVCFFGFPQSLLSILLYKSYRGNIFSFYFRIMKRNWGKSKETHCMYVREEEFFISILLLLLVKILGWMKNLLQIYIRTYMLH